MPIGACSNGTSFSSRACGAWSVATQSMVPLRSASTSAARSPSAVSGGCIFMRVSSPRTASSVSSRWCGVTSRAHAPAARLGGGDRLDRGGAAEVLEVHARVLVAGELGVARDHRRLGHGGDAGEAERGAQRPLVHDAAARERAVLLVQREHAAAQALVLQRLAQHARARDRLAVVGEAERALCAQLGHLGQLLAPQAAGDRGQEADGDARLARGARAASAAAARSRSRGRCWASRSRRRSRPRRRRGCRCRGPPCAPGRACAGARAGRRTPGSRRRRPSPSISSSSPASARACPRRRARRSRPRARARRGARRCARAGRARARRAAAARARLARARR